MFESLTDISHHQHQALQLHAYMMLTSAYYKSRSAETRQVLLNCRSLVASEMVLDLHMLADWLSFLKHPNL
jgi:hypothetical protein